MRHRLKYQKGSQEGENEVVLVVVLEVGWLALGQVTLMFITPFAHLDFWPQETDFQSIWQSIL